MRACVRTCLSWIVCLRYIKELRLFDLYYGVAFVCVCGLCLESFFMFDINILRMFGFDCAVVFA